MYLNAEEKILQLSKRGIKREIIYEKSKFTLSQQLFLSVMQLLASFIFTPTSSLSFRGGERGKTKNVYTYLFKV